LSPFGRAEPLPVHAQNRARGECLQCLTGRSRATPLPNHLRRDTIARMATSSVPKYLVIAGSVLILAAAGVALALTRFDRTHDITSILVSAYPIALMAAVLGAVMTLLGTVRWVYDFSSQKNAIAGVALVCLGGSLFVIINQMPFGFDDPSILFAQVVFYTPLLNGLVCLLLAAARHGKSNPHH
jgi:hypothetical protein